MQLKHDVETVDRRPDVDPLYDLGEWLKKHMPEVGPTPRIQGMLREALDDEETKRLAAYLYNAELQAKGIFSAVIVENTQCNICSAFIVQVALVAIISVNLFRLSDVHCHLRCTDVQASKAVKGHSPLFVVSFYCILL